VTLSIRAQLSVGDLQTEIYVKPALYILFLIIKGEHGGAIGWSTALRAGRSRVRFSILSLEFFTDI